MRPYPLLVAAVALAACRSGPPARPVPGGEALGPEAAAAYARAVEVRAEGDPEKADRFLALPLAVRPIHVPSHLLHQDLRRATGRGEGLAAEYARIAGEVPGDADAALLAARVAGLGPRERVAAYQAATLLDQKRPWPRVALCVARAELAAALEREAVEKAIAGFQDRAAELRAEARRLAEGARAEGDRARALAPDLAAAHAALGHAAAVLASRKDATPGEKREALALALECLTRAARIDPGDARILAERAQVLRWTGDARGAADDLARAAAAAPRDPAILAARARVLDDLEGGRDAVAAWKAAVTVSPRDPGLVTDYGSALARAGRWEDSLKQYRRADSLFQKDARPDRWRARIGLATALAQLGLADRDEGMLREAADQLRAYRREGGPGTADAERLAAALGVGPEGK